MQVDQEQLDKAIRRYLDSKSVVLWADWDLTKQDRRDEARSWLKNEINTVLALVPDEEDDDKCGVLTCSCCYDELEE